MVHIKAHVLNYFVFPVTAVTNHPPVREAAERVLPRACCACSHQLQGQTRDIGTLTRLRIIGRDRKHGHSVPMVLILMILLFMLVSVAIVNVPADVSAAIFVVGAKVAVVVALLIMQLLFLLPLLLLL